jgi:hypothetical protein
MMPDSEAIDRSTGGPRDSSEFSAFEGDARSGRDATLQPKPMERVAPEQPLGPADGERRDP